MRLIRVDRAMRKTVIDAEAFERSGGDQTFVIDPPVLTFEDRVDAILSGWMQVFDLSGVVDEDDLNGVSFAPTDAAAIAGDVENVAGDLWRAFERESATGPAKAAR